MWGVRGECAGSVLFILLFKHDLLQISENLGVTPDNMSSPPPSELIPPTHIFASWLFEVSCLVTQWSLVEFTVHTHLVLNMKEREKRKLCRKITGFKQNISELVVM